MENEIHLASLFLGITMGIVFTLTTFTLFGGTKHDNN